MKIVPFFLITVVAGLAACAAVAAPPAVPTRAYPATITSVSLEKCRIVPGPQVQPLVSDGKCPPADIPFANYVLPWIDATVTINGKSYVVEIDGAWHPACYMNSPQSRCPGQTTGGLSIPNIQSGAIYAQLPRDIYPIYVMLRSAYLNHSPITMQVVPSAIEDGHLALSLDPSNIRMISDSGGDAFRTNLAWQAGGGFWGQSGAPDWGQ